MRSSIMPLIGALLGLAVASDQASAAIQIFTDRNAFLAATTVTTNITFDNLTNPANTTDYDSYSSPSGLTVDGVNFVGHTPHGLGPTWILTPPSFYPDYYLFVADQHADPQGSFDWGPGSTLAGFYGNSFDYKDSNIVINLPQNTCCFGTDIMMRHLINEHGGHVTITLSDGEQFVLDLNTYPDNRGFFGFKSETQVITSVTIHAGAAAFPYFYGPNGHIYLDGGYPLLDNVVLGECPPEHIPTPEPASLIVFTMSMVGTGFFARRRLKA